MANTIMKLYTTISSRLSQLPVKDGQLIFVSDTKKVYLDFNGVRVSYSTINSFSTDKERIECESPAKGFYFVQETGVLWNYDTSWKQLTPDNLQQIYFGSGIEAFPEEGNDKLLYVADDATYKWDSATKQYLVVANKTEWTSLKN